MKLTIGYFYKHHLNLYGDNGNVEILKYRAEKRGIQVDIVHIDESTILNNKLPRDINLAFMGGGPDSGQKVIYSDLISNKGACLKEYIQQGGVGLYVCGAYQLLGKYYKAADGTILKGLGILDFYTQHFGLNKPRIIGNTVATISTKISEDPVFKNINKIGNNITGFENHGGRTYLGDSIEPFATIITGKGNNSEDNTGGVLYNNTIGTYFHGPILARNPHLADYLIAKAIKRESLEELDDSLIIAAHTASTKLKSEI